MTDSTNKTFLPDTFGTEQSKKTKKVRGRIIMCQGGLYTVQLDAQNGDLPALISCKARGSFRHKSVTPLAGDIVTVDFDTSDAYRYTQDLPEKSKKAASAEDNGARDFSAVIDSVEPRRNYLIRPPLANADYLFITMAAASPAPVLETIDKLICIAEFNEITPVIIVGKCELSEESTQKIRAVYELAGYRVLCVSCHHGYGIKEAEEYIKGIMNGKIVALAGASGVGKSSLLNIISPDLQLSTSDVSRKTERGRHTTRKVELFPFCGGYIADTPGFSMLDFEKFDFFDKEDLANTFIEFRDRIGTCRYTKCTHTKEDGCSVLEGVKNGEIAPSRHESYVALYNILKQKKAWDKKQ